MGKAAEPVSLNARLQICGHIGSTQREDVRPYGAKDMSAGGHWMKGRAST
jgi:hypothetical protein